jgi:hypothetical protein
MLKLYVFDIFYTSYLPYRGLNGSRSMQEERKGQHRVIKVCQWLVTGQWFSLGTLVSSTNKTDRHDITEILLKVALNTITLRPKKIIASFSSTAVCVFLLPHWSILHWEKKMVSVSGHFRVRSVGLLITIIVSQAFMLKACMVVSGISCHCIWTNTDYYKQTKKVPPCLIKMFGNWPEKLIIFFVWPNPNPLFKFITSALFSKSVWQ